MLSFVTSALAMAAPVTDHFLGVKCAGDFSHCSGGVDTNAAKLHHIQKLKQSHGVLANVDVSCSNANSAKLAPGNSYESTTHIPLMGDVLVTLAVDSFDGQAGKATISSTNPIKKFSCEGVKFEQDGTTITLSKKLSEQCDDAILTTLDVKQLQFCADQSEVHATIATPFVDLHVIAK